MSITCPKCGTEIDQDFGLVNCPNCSTVLAIDVEGNVQVPAEAAQEESNQNFVEQPEYSEVQEIPEAPEGIEQAGEPTSEQSNETSNSEFVEMNLDAQMSSASEPETSPEQNQNTDFRSFDEPEIPAAPAAVPQSDLDDITKFGNKDSSTGPLSYSVMVDGIDVSTIRADVLSALDEPQFGWSSKDLARRIQNGQLVLKDLSAAQAVMVLRVLRGVKVRLSWKQQVYS